MLIMELEWYWILVSILSAGDKSVLSLKIVKMGFLSFYLLSIHRPVDFTLTCIWNDFSLPAVEIFKCVWVATYHPRVCYIDLSIGSEQRLPAVELVTIFIFTETNRPLGNAFYLSVHCFSAFISHPSQWILKNTFREFAVGREPEASWDAS